MILQRLQYSLMPMTYASRSTSLDGGYAKQLQREGPRRMRAGDAHRQHPELLDPRMVTVSLREGGHTRRGAGAIRLGDVPVAQLAEDRAILGARSV